MENTQMQNSQDENIMLLIIRQSLEGVMFHNFKIDFYDILGLEGFKKMHSYQYEKEGFKLEEIKHQYIMKYGKLPILNIEKKDYWKNYETMKSNIPEDQLATMVKDSLKQYADWENSVLTNLLTWKRSSTDRILIHQMIQDELKEIDRIETIMDILKEHNFNYECIYEMSDYLKRKIK